MTIRTKDPGVPSSFPPARLFLDDIEEIVRELVSALENHHQRAREHSDAETKVTFTIRDQVCDEVLELPKIAAKTTDLNISVEKGKWSEISLDFHERFTTIFCLTFAKQEKIAIFHKLNPIFQRRQLRWNTLVHSHDSLGAAINFIPYVVAVASVVLLRSKQTPLWIPILTGVLSVATIITIWATRLHHCIVVLRPSSEPSPVRQGLRDKLPATLIGIAIGSVLTFFLTVLGYYLKHKYWP